MEASWMKALDTGYRKAVGEDRQRARTLV